MKVNDLKKIIREEVTKVVRKELVGFVKLLGESNKPKAKPKQKIKKKPVTEQSLKDMLGDFQDTNFKKETTKQHYTSNPVLNDILNLVAAEYLFTNFSSMGTNSPFPSTSNFII